MKKPPTGEPYAGKPPVGFGECGGGIVPSFEFAVQDGFNTGGYFKPTVGLVAQAGSDYMFNRNWGVFLDVKKLFIWSTGEKITSYLDFP